jgi:hypothetical protein
MRLERRSEREKTGDCLLEKNKQNEKRSARKNKGHLRGTGTRKEQKNGT